MKTKTLLTLTDGHWEVARANGIQPANDVVVVSPFRVSRAMSVFFAQPKSVKNKTSQKVLDVRGGLNTPGTQIWQYDINGTDAQKFTFVDARNGYFYIMTKANLYLSLKSSLAISDGSSASSGNSRILVQDNKYETSLTCNASVTANCPKHQWWKVTPVPNEPSTFILESAAFPNQVLQPQSNAAQTALAMANYSGSENQKWQISDPSQISANTKLYEWNNLPSSSLANFNWAMGVHQGILGKDYFEPAESFIGNDPIDAFQAKPGYNPTHKPIDGYKRTHTGMLLRVERADPGWIDKDDDLCAYIQPVPGSIHYENYLSKGLTNSTLIEGEIDVKDENYEAIRQFMFPKLGHVSLFGPWVHEKHDYKTPGFKPHDYMEVHPSENIWATTLIQKRLVYNIGVFSDNSGRFNKWRGNPVKSLNAIAFQYTSGEVPLGFVITERSGKNYKVYNDNVNRHQLMDGNTTILTIEEPNNYMVDIAFQKVEKKIVNGKTIYSGFIISRAEVSDGGYLTYSLLTRNEVANFSEAEVEVTLKEIKCVGVDDSGDAEEIYGRYVVGAVSGMRPFHTTVYCLDGSDGTLWYRSESDHISLQKGQSRAINVSKRFLLPSSGQITLWGDLSEDDNDVIDNNDALGKPNTLRYNVLNLPLQVDFPVKHVYKSGGTNIEVLLTIRRNR